MAELADIERQKENTHKEIVRLEMKIEWIQEKIQSLYRDLEILDNMEISIETYNELNNTKTEGN